MNSWLSSVRCSSNHVVVFTVRMQVTTRAGLRGKGGGWQEEEGISFDLYSQTDDSFLVSVVTTELKMTKLWTDNKTANRNAQCSRVFLHLGVNEWLHLTFKCQMNTCFLFPPLNKMLFILTSSQTTRSHCYLLICCCKVADDADDFHAFTTTIWSFITRPFNVTAESGKHWHKPETSPFVLNARGIVKSSRTGSFAWTRPAKYSRMNTTYTRTKKTMKNHKKHKRSVNVTWIASIYCERLTAN